MPKTEKILMLAVAVLLLPTLLYTGFLAHMAFDEGAKFRDAPELPDEGRESGEFYKLTGAIADTLLQPADHPEANGALQMRITRERRASTAPDAAWTEDESVPADLQRIDTIEIRGVPVRLGETSRFVMPVEKATRELSPTERLVVQWRPAAGKRVVAWGVYQHGSLQEGTYDRLLVVDEAQVDETLRQIAAAGRTKAAIMGVIALVLVVILAAVVRSALHNSSS